MTDTIKFYCESCMQHQPVEIEELKTDGLNDVPWGDIVCELCHFVIATISADKPGKVEFLFEGKKGT